MFFKLVLYECPTSHHFIILVGGGQMSIPVICLGEGRGKCPFKPIFMEGGGMSGRTYVRTPP